MLCPRSELTSPLPEWLRPVPIPCPSPSSGSTKNIVTNALCAEEGVPFINSTRDSQEDDGRDAELIALLVAIFETLGLGQKDFRIRLSAIA